MGNLFAQVWRGTCSCSAWDSVPAEFCLTTKGLQLGDDVRSADGGTGEVEQVTTEQTTAEMYNLTVDEAHTFTVGHGQWLVHNTCDFRRIAYGSDELSRAAQQFRIDFGLHGSGTNIAVFQLDGHLPSSLIDEITANPKWLRADDNLIIAKNAGKGGDHAEVVLNNLLKNNGIDRTQVAAVYSEFSSCTGNNSCFDLLNFGGYRNNLPVRFSFQYPNERIIRNSAIQNLITNGNPGIIVP
ncbi:MAG: hypothetical protein K8S20_15550 [Chloroflexi bacterium]|nr:hypothetical protein [Chloroflexota bacterium]